MRRYLAVFAVIISLCTPSWSAVKGTVINKDGKPISKATIYGIDYNNGNTSIKYKVQSDKNGQFSYPGKIDDSYMVAFADGYSYGAGYRRRIDEDIKITLWPDQTIKGKIVDINGKPLPGTRVSLSRFDAFYQNGSSFGDISFDSNNTPGIGVDIITGKDGTFQLSHIPDSDGLSGLHFTISAVKPGYALINASYSNTSLADNVEIVIPRECIIEGTLYLPDKTTPAPEKSRLIAQIKLESGTTAIETRETFIGKDGKFRFAQLPPGKVVIGLYPMVFPKEGSLTHLNVKLLDWVLPAVEGLELKSGTPLKLELAGVRGVNIKGQVIDKTTEKPISNAQIIIYDPSRPEALPGYNQTNEKGEFTARVAPGAGRIVVNGYRTEKTYVNYNFDDRPITSFTAVAGEDISDIVVKVTPPNNSDVYDDSYSLAQTKPIPQDLKLIPGTYTLAWDPNFDCSVARYYNSLYRDKAAVAKIKKLPELKSKNPGYQIFKFDGAGDNGLLAVVLDESKGTGKGYDTAYIDQNRNLDLSDDAPITWEGSDKDFSRNTEFVTMQSHQGKSGGEQAQHTVQIRFRIQKHGEYLDTYLQSKGTWVGTIDSNKGKIPFAVIDSNTNGVYGDIMVMNDAFQPQQPDSAFADLNNVGKLVMYSNSKHNLALNEATEVAGNFYKIRISPLGDKVSIEPYEGKLGKILLSGKDIGGLNASASKVYLMGKPGLFEFNECNGSAVTVPVGKYRLAQCELTLDSKILKSPKILCGSNADIDVKPDQQVDLEIGGKLTTALCPDRKELVFHSGNSESITWVTNVGSKASIISLGDIDPNQGVRVKFFNEKKELVQTVKAGYT